MKLGMNVPGQRVACRPTCKHAWQTRWLRDHQAKRPHHSTTPLTYDAPWLLCCCPLANHQKTSALGLLMI